MKRIIKLALLIYILENAGTAAGKIMDRLPERDAVTGKFTEVNEDADELFRSLGFEPQKPKAS